MAGNATNRIQIEFKNKKKLRVGNGNQKNHVDIFLVGCVFMANGKQKTTPTHPRLGKLWAESPGEGGENRLIRRTVAIASNFTTNRSCKCLELLSHPCRIHQPVIIPEFYSCNISVPKPYLKWFERPSKITLV